MDIKSAEWRPGPNNTVCRCCLAEGCYKDISTEYFWMGKREVYSEMLQETFDIGISYSQSGGPNSNSRLICEPCISRLRDASEFKRQVQECEKTFMQHLDPVSSASTIAVEVPPVDKVKLETVKLEKSLSDDDFDARYDDDDDDDLDDQPLTKLKMASKVPKKESVDLLDLLDNTSITVKRKSLSKIKAVPAKKAKTKKEVVKATSSKTTAKPVEPPKKKKVSDRVMAKGNAEVVLKYSTVKPFRLRGKILLCVYCQDDFEEPDQYREHLDLKHETFSIAAAFSHTCKNKYRLKVDLTDLKCRLCHEKFTRLEDIASHLKDTHDIKRINLNYDVGLQPYVLTKDKWLCYVCNEKLPTLTKLTRHTTSHYKKYSCDSCDRSYLTFEALKYHVRCSHGEKPVCRKCWAEFPSQEEKKEHLKNSKSCRLFACVICMERFLSWEAKTKHQIKEHGLKTSTYPCPDCDQVFTGMSARQDFYNHFKIAHSKDHYVCPYCDQKFDGKSDFDIHKLIHTNEKNYKCPVCMKKFSRNKYLKQHMWIHSETKRFACGICEKQFNQKATLKAHLKSRHSNLNIEIDLN